jgi:hypothetical protein
MPVKRLEETAEENRERLQEAYARVKDKLQVSAGQRETLRRAAEKLKVRVR